MIPEAIVERKYDVEVDESGKQIKQRDVNRSPNVTEVLDNFIHTHNESLPENSPQRLVWFSDSLTNRQRQKRAKNIIRAKLHKHCRPEWLDGSITFNACQMEHGGELEVCIEEINGVPLMAVYAQAERSWAVRRMMEDIFANRRRTYLKKMRSAEHSTLAEECQKVQTVPDVILEHGQSKSANVMNEAEAASAAARAFSELKETSDKAIHQLEAEQSFSQPRESSENLSDIDEQIALLKSKKKRMQRERNEKKRRLENAIERSEDGRTRESSKRVRKAGKKEKVGKKTKKN